MRWINPFQNPFRRIKPAPALPRYPSIIPEDLTPEAQGCDACGRSAIDGRHLSLAKFLVMVGDLALHLCGHHARKHALHIIKSGHDLKELQ